MEKLKSSITRKLLLVFPTYARSFGTFQHAFSLKGVKAFMLPQGLIQLAGLLPENWELRFIDENIESANPEDFEWADAVLISGMHAQRLRILDINARAHHAGKLTVLGGPSVSAAPDWYSEVDILHCGEVGDSTQDLVKQLELSVQRLSRQLVFRTSQRFNLTDLPTPAYHLADLRNYMIASIQFSSGCPYTCEFCDIPSLYGRAPRYKTPAQIIAELDQIVTGRPDTVYFVDDNFVANPNATTELLPHLIHWQRSRGYPLRFSCEATLNIAQRPLLLSMMREAWFRTIFCGIETPEPNALRAMSKTQNLRSPILDAVAKINEHGMKVAAGIIIGLDTDTDRTVDAILDFVEQSQIPLLAVNLLYALPRTPLYERLSREKRIVPDHNRDSNIAFVDPYETVVRRWSQVVSSIYSPPKVYARFETQCKTTYSHRFQYSNKLEQLNWANLKKAVQILSRLIWRAGVREDYRTDFWRMFWRELRKGKIERIYHIGLVAHHLITYARECARGTVSSSNYATRQETSRGAGEFSRDSHT